MPATEVKQLLLTVDATVELLRKNMLAGESAVKRSTDEMQRRLDASDRRFERFGKPLTGIGAAVQQVNRQVATIGTSVDAVERRMRASAAGIRSSLLASTAGIAAAFSAKQVQELADGYTRFTNQLKVAGLEGGALASVQQRLFDIAQRNGAPLEAIGTLYGRASQAGKALGASQSDLIKFSGAVGAALKVQGGSAEEAQGALLQLAQALGSGTVHAEEFNSVNEGLRPILQAAAEASDKYKGSVAALRSDVIAQKVSSQELFRLILAGYDSLQVKAGKAGLTIGASFTILNNALSQGIGQADAAVGGTEKVSAAIVALADNLDTIIPALAGIATGYATVKAGRLAWTAATAAGARILGTEQELLGQTAVAIARGNASYIDNTTLKAKAAIAARETAAAEVEAIEARLVAEREEARQLEANLALIQRQRAEAQRSQVAIAESQRIGFGTLGQGGGTTQKSQIDAGRALKAEIATKDALIATNARVALSEESLAAAKTTATVATEAEVVATRAATSAGRISAGVTALLSGAMSTLTAALPIIAIGALVASFIAYRQAAAEAEENTKGIAEQARRLAEKATLAASAGHDAAGGLNAAGSAAATNTGKMAAFAGAVGDAAQKLRELAVERRKAAIDEAKNEVKEATDRVQKAQTQRLGASAGPFSFLSSIPGVTVPGTEKARASANLDASNRNLTAAQQQLAAAQRRALSSYIVQSDRTGSRDLNAELDRINVDLIVARKAGLKSQVNDLQAEAFERKRTLALMKSGQSFEAASAQASKEASRIRSAGDAKIASDDAKRSNAATARAARGAATEKRKEEAAVRDAAADARAYAADERQANDQIAAAHAELSNSAEERAQIERDRIRADLASKNAELALQAKQGRFGTGKEATDRVTTLQGLNTRAADAQIAVVDRREEQRRVDEGAEVAVAHLSAERQALQDASQLAVTADERRKIELRILDLQYEEERLRLEAVLDYKSNATSGERARALIDYNTLDARKASAATVVVANTRGNAEGYRERLRASAANVGDAIDGIKVQAIDNLSDGISNAAGRLIKLGGVAGDVASQIIASFAKIAIEKFIAPGLGGLLGLSGGGRVSAPGFADGGTPSRAGNRITGPGDGQSDSVLALLPNGKPIRVANGESIVTAQGTRDHWPLIDAINRGRLPRFAAGGAPTPIFASRMPDIRGSGGRGTTVHQHFELKGNLITEQVYRDIDIRAAQAAQSALAVSVDHTNRSIADLSRTRL